MEKDKKDCSHDSVKLVGAIFNTHLCVSCGGQLVVNEIEIMSSFHEVGAFCNNDKCDRYVILVI